MKVLDYENISTSFCDTVLTIYKQGGNAHIQGIYDTFIYSIPPGKNDHYVALKYFARSHDMMEAYMRMVEMDNFWIDSNLKTWFAPLTKSRFFSVRLFLTKLIYNCAD